MLCKMEDVLLCHGHVNVKLLIKELSISQSNQEEADTKLLLHALDASANGATILTIHSLDTDVFVLSLRCFPELCQNTYFVTGTGQRHKDEG